VPLLKQKTQENTNKVIGLSFAEIQNQYATLIEELGQTRLPTGKTISETLTIEGIPFWEIFSAELAWRHLTTAAAATTPLANVKLLLKPRVLRLKDALKDLAWRHRDLSGCAGWPGGPTILALGFTPRMYRDVLAPVIEDLTADGACRAVVLEDVSSLGASQSDRKGIAFQQIWQHWDEDVRQSTRQLRTSIRRIGSGLDLAKALPSMSTAEARPAAVALEKAFRLLLNCYLPLILPQAAIAKHILTKHRPVLVLSPDTSDARTRIYTLLSRKLDIPCMDIQFGLAGAESIEWRFFAADLVAVWGATSQEALLKQKVPMEKILLTGSPRHDSLVQVSKPLMDAARTRLGLRDGRRIILLASTYTDSSHNEYTKPEVLREMKRAIFKAAKNNPGIVLIVKPHPHEKVEETRALAQAAGNIIFAEQQSDIRDLIALCDAFISFGSTATIDALIADKLSICPIFTGWPFSEEFRRSGAVLAPQSEEQVNEVFRKIAQGLHEQDMHALRPAREKYLEKIAYKADGLAAARIGARARALAGIETNR